MEKEFLLYLLYGFTFINMGIFSLKEKGEEVSNLLLVKSLKFLGFFGITHGLSEWITMMEIAQLYSDYYTYSFIIKQFLKAASFAFLMQFGINLLPLDAIYKNKIRKLPTTLFIIWLGGFLYLIVLHNTGYHIYNPKFNTIMLRYILGFFGGSITAIALFLNAMMMKNKSFKEIVKRYKSLAYIFMLYGILDGIFVKKADFFPANILNNAFFLKKSKIPIQVLKTLVGVSVNILLIRVIDTFRWERKEKLNRLRRQRASYEERRKLGLEIHDNIIQDLYAVGLKVEYLAKSKGAENNDLLKAIKTELNNTIKKTRKFLIANTLDIIELEDLQTTLQQLVDKFNKSQNVAISLFAQGPLLKLGQLSPVKSTQIYYIVQEAISNIIKHSEATNAQVLLRADYDMLHIKVIDNGVGICHKAVSKKTRFGIRSMRARAERIGGTVNISKRKDRGTEVELMIPWEESRDGLED